MRNKVDYEWDIQERLGDEILENNFREKLNEYPYCAFDVSLVDGDALKLVLNRYAYNDDDGLVDHQWAYVESGVLPETFDDGAKVPKRFHLEYNRWLKSQMANKS